MSRINKVANFADIHFGRKNNSEQHNKDCLNYINWFCENVKNDPTIDAIIFLGDWHEQRSAINGLTLEYSYKAAKLLDELGLPIYFIVGNHDLYYRNNRNVYTTTFFKSLNNFILVDKMLEVKEFGKQGALICPYLFPEEYIEFRELINSYQVVFGHFEFKNYVVAGDTVVLEHGPDEEDFNKPKRIFSGHFHKRQLGKNIIYIGSTFPMDFSDANDPDRGMAIYDFDLDKVEFKNWEECPTYIKTSLTKLLKSHKTILKQNATVKCLVDKDISLEESTQLKEKFVSQYNLRELTFEEEANSDIITDTEMDLSGMELEDTDSIVINLIGRIPDDTKFKKEKLQELYKRL